MLHTHTPATYYVGNTRARHAVTPAARTLEALCRRRTPCLRNTSHGRGTAAPTTQSCARARAAEHDGCTCAHTSPVPPRVCNACRRIALCVVRPFASWFSVQLSHIVYGVSAGSPLVARGVQHAAW